MKSINDRPFELTYIDYNDTEYLKSIQSKNDILMSKFENVPVIKKMLTECEPLLIVNSPTKHLRQRCRFAIVHGVYPYEGNDFADTHGLCRLDYAMWESGGPNITVESFPIASIQIFNIMPVMLRQIEMNINIYDDLRAINYLSSSTGHLIATLVYERPLDNTWLEHAENLRMTLTNMNIPHITDISIIGRSKGVKLVAGKEYVLESLTLSDGRVLHYKQVDEGFSNPNSSVNAKVLDWLCDASKIVNGNNAEKRDLLEMFCGNGNHTVALAGCFRHVFAVELNKALCVAAEENFAMNGIENATVIACDSAKFAMRILRDKFISSLDRRKMELNNRVRVPSGILSDQPHPDKQFASVPITSEVPTVKLGVTHNAISKDSSKADTYDFAAVLVDPPRSGLDSDTCRMIAQYEYIMYISCQPDSLIRDLQLLSTTHRLLRIASFDHFAYTPHLECGVLLQRK